MRGEVGTAHDDYYRRLCQSFGWGEEVYGAKIDSSILQKINAQKKNSRKAEKLLALANNNPSWEEAQSALMKAKALMDKSLTSQSSDSEYVALELTYGTRISSKLQTVTWLLESFNCKTIFLTTPGRFTLEVICKNQDMENILDLFNFFNQQIDLWYLESKKYNGKLHRGSFYKGLYQGFKQKLQQNNKVVFEHEKTLIQVDEENLKKHFRMLYPRVGSSYTKVKNDAQSFYQGILQGRRLELKNKLKNDKYFLT